MQFQDSFFPWGSLPYPQESARRMQSDLFAFQEATLDHHGKPILSLFRQEKGCSYEELEKLNTQFFAAIKQQPSSESQFIDEEIGMVSYRNRNQTILCLGSGCKSGMGAFLKGDVGILNFGVQQLPLDQCASFGLAGRGKNIVYSKEGGGFHFSYRCRLALAHPNNRVVSGFQDSGYSGQWIEAQIEYNQELKVASEILSVLERENSMLFFVRAKKCLADGTHRLQARSLDRYLGPVCDILLEGAEDTLSLKWLQGAQNVEIFPLAGDESFWGADFLISYPINSPYFSFVAE